MSKKGVSRTKLKPAAPPAPELPPEPATVPGAPMEEWDVDTDPQKNVPLPSIVLDPELEEVAERPESGPKKKKPGAKK